MKILQLKCDILVLSCIDYRFPHLVCDYLDAQGLIGNYDIFTLPGASLGACCPEYPHWNETFEEVVTLAKKLHSIKKIIVLNHEECGAFQNLRGVPKRKEDEVVMHRQQATIAQGWIQTHFPDLEVEFLYINLCGKTEKLL